MSRREYSNQNDAQKLTALVFKNNQNDAEKLTALVFKNGYMPILTCIFFNFN